jgi:amino acid adenylation domain-containing protein
MKSERFAGGGEKTTDQATEDQWNFNALVPQARNECIHDLIKAQAGEHPAKIALHSSNEDLTYGELDKLSDKLAHRLVELGARAEEMVPLCFEKSVWTVVAMLGVLKAGAAFVLIDAALPVQRLQSIVQQCCATRVCSSTEQQALSNRFGIEVVTVERIALDGYRRGPTSVLPAANPSAPMYIVFTSGSTGTPKGIVVPHSSFCTALHHQLPLLNIDSSSRVFDFASYSFDVAVHNNLATLAAGGCVCVPSDQQRKEDFNHAMNRLRVNVVNLTASMARLLNVEGLERLDTLLLLGEAASAYDIAGWRGKVKVVNTYGPAECTPITTINYGAGDAAAAAAIGKGVSAVIWVVDPEDHNKLATLGVTGELLIEGPILARGYLYDAAKTAAAFIEDPTWLTKGGPGVPGRRGRVYKTGDLVRYNTDGTLQFVGRKDAQVKIRGQRVELGEVETHVRTHMVGGADAAVVAEIIRLQGGEHAMLVAFVGVGGGPDGDAEVNMSVFTRMMLGIDNRLAAALPAYMVPSAYVPLERIPMTATGKTDRRQLREMGDTMTLEQLAALQPSRGKRRAPSTEAERRLQQLWASVLNIGADKIGLDDSFLRMGGDSIQAMRLVGAAREQGVAMTVEDVFHCPTLVSLAARARSNSPQDLSVAEPTPFSLLIPTEKHRIIDSAASLVGQCRFSDILPVTAFQHISLVRYARWPSQGLYYQFVDFGPMTDTDRLEKSCRELVRQCSILRTIFMRSRNQYFQIVLHYENFNLAVLQTQDNLAVLSDKICLEDAKGGLRLGSSPVKFMLLRNERRGCRLVFRLSHAQYDGIAVGIMIRSLLDLYQGKAIPIRTQFSSFLKHCQQQKATSSSYWQQLLHGASPTKILLFLSRPTELTPEDEIPINLMVEKDIELPSLPSGIRLASVVSSAWALVLSRISGLQDVIYGQVVHGRNAAIAGVEEIVGPCMNYVPVRVRFQPEWTPHDLFNAVQRQQDNLRASDTFDWCDVSEQATEWSKCCHYDSVVQHQSLDQLAGLERYDDVLGMNESSPCRVFPPILKIYSFPRGTDVRLRLQGNTNIISNAALSLLLERIRSVIIELSVNSGTHSTGIHSGNRIRLHCDGPLERRGDAHV